MDELLKIHEDKLLKKEQEYSKLNFSTQIDRQELIRQEEENFNEMIFTLKEKYE